MLQRYRRLQRQKARRHQSRLEWRQTGTVWAADFKERREPIEGRYGWILAVKDLASRYQLAWLPVAEATAEVVQATYARLFTEHGPPLVLKTDNGGPFKADTTKQLLADHAVTPLYSPRRRPGYNGGIERANAQLAGYQEALAEFRGRPGLPTCEDAQSAQRLANELARPDGWRGPTAAELWHARMPIGPQQRVDFLAAIGQRRSEVRRQLNFALDAWLDHYAQAAVDRRAVRDALVAGELLVIHPRHKRRGAKATGETTTLKESAPIATQAERSAGIIELTPTTILPMVGGAPASTTHNATPSQTQTEEVHSSTIKTSASGQD
jgi:transposase InsO family protein